MSDTEIVGHKTFYEKGSFRHEPLTRIEADKLLANAKAEKEKRAADMPTEKDAVNALWSAHYRLKELGWNDPRFAHELKKEGLEAQLIELGSSGIHVGSYHKTNGRDVWWSGEEGYPIHPVLVKAIERAAKGGGG
jgi:hypothetical protein